MPTKKDDKDSATLLTFVPNDRAIREARQIHINGKWHDGRQKTKNDNGENFSTFGH